jgi:hypothetical protein
LVIFRSANLRTAAAVLRGMVGLHGVGLSGLRGDVGLKGMAFWIGAPAFIALACANTLEIMSPYEPALGWKSSPNDGAIVGFRAFWKPSLVWAFVVSVIAAIGILNLGGHKEFLYWQF